VYFHRGAITIRAKAEITAGPDFEGIEVAEFPMAETWEINETQLKCE
jgi:hypothetical protein